ELFDALVAIAGLRVFVLQVECLAKGAGGDHVEGPAGERVHAAHRAAGVDLAADGVELPEQTLTVVHALGVDAVGEPEVLDARAPWGERPVRDAEITRLGAGAAAAPQAHERRNVVPAAGPQLGHHRPEARVLSNAVRVLAVAGAHE